MGKRNFLFRIEGTGQEDVLDAMIMGLNMMAEELEAAFALDGLSMTFILTRDFKIEMVGPGVKQGLRFDAIELKGKPFSDLLDDNSQKLWGMSGRISPTTAIITRPLNYRSEPGRAILFLHPVPFLQRLA